MNTPIKILLSTKTRRAIARVLAADRAGLGYDPADGELRDRFLRLALDLAREAAGARRARRKISSRAGSPAGDRATG